MVTTIAATHQAAVTDLIKRIDSAEAWSGTHVAEARKIWEDLDGISPLDSEQFVLSSIAEPVTSESEIVAAVQQQADVFFARGIIEHQFDAKVLIDSLFAA